MNKKQAWTAADNIFPTDYIYDAGSSSRAGYDIYRSTDPARYYCYICDLGDRLEVNTDDGKTVNVWYENIAVKEYQIADALEIISDAIYQIDDKISTVIKDKTGIGSARRQLYAAYRELRDLLDDVNPGSDLYEKYNLAEA